jgi:N-acetylated-alpha-linked acidic dipeptidase
VEESPTIMKIPVLPLSYGDALPLLRQLGGPAAPAEWRGALPVTYHLGPGPARVHVRTRFDWSLRPAQNVIAVLEGTEYPDEWVVRGNHRDGWAMGAADPISGMVALMAEARAVGRLAAEGRRPRRTIVYASWDAEEPGLLGSTEWAEHHADELREKAVAYINTDGSGRGFLNIGGSHTLERFANQLGLEVEDPQTGVSVEERARARAAVTSGDPEVLDGPDRDISPLGSGSDYTPFLQHLGVASLNLGFGGENGGGSYHSMFDSFDHYTRFGDPTFEYGVALARVAGRATLRLANADVVPLRFANFHDHVESYLDELEALADELREQAEARRRLTEANAWALAADPTETWVDPEPLEPVPFFNFAPLENALAQLERAARDYDAALGESMAGGGPPPGRIQELNRTLVRTERLMTREEGLPRRPWFRHMIYAPGFYTGYGVKTLPGVREGLEERHWDEVEQYVSRVAESLESVARAVEEGTALLGGAG